MNNSPHILNRERLITKENFSSSISSFIRYTLKNSITKVESNACVVNNTNG